MELVLSGMEKELLTVPLSATGNPDGSAHVHVQSCPGEVLGRHLRKYKV